VAKIDDLEIGQSASYERTVSEEDIVRFAEVSGDDNPVHLDEEFASKTLFKGRIAHGMLGAGFISTVVGTKLPGYGSIYISQSLKFRAPVRIGDTVVTTATVKSIDKERKRVTMETVCAIGDKIVIDGEAELMLTA
jgi:3-hydroxybutyryl-CoA dehydratase